jgi:hypothetical protein
VFGRIKKIIGHGVAAVERSVLPPAPLSSEVLASRVILVGASVSEFWHVEVRYPCVSIRTLYTFDKTPVIDELLSSNVLVDAIIIKQCAAYFPIPLEEKKPLVLGWLDRIHAAGVRPIVATVVPVTARHDRNEPGRFEGLIEYNDWITEISRERGILLLDLEAPIRRSPSDRHLDERWATRDGLHLRHQAYRQRLDPILLPVLGEALEE